MDSLVKSNIAPHQEYLLQGSIMDSSCEVLLHRLRGLCDNVEAGPETFHDHEMVYQILNTKGKSFEKTSYGTLGTTATPVTLRVRQALDHPDSPWSLRYVGQSEVGDKNRSTLIRNYIDVATSDNLCMFLNEMGFKLDHEYVVKGYLFRKGRMKVTVSKIFRMLQASKTDTVDSLSLSYLVELSVVAPSGQDAVADDMKVFAEQLKPLVQLDKDHPRPSRLHL